VLKTPHIALLAVVLVLCSCAKTLTREEPRELTLRPVASVSTKADPELDGASLGTDNTYVIYASASATGNPAYLTGQLFTYYSSSAAWKASSGTPGNYESSPVYWPLSGTTVDFLALALKPEANTALTTAPGSIAWNGSSQGGSAGGVTIANWDTYANQYDVLYAVSNAQSGSSNPDGTVPLNFQHTMAVVGFTARSASDAGIFTLKGLTLKNLQFKGSLVIDNTTTEVAPTWSVPEGDAYQNDKEMPLTMAEFSVPGSGATGLAIKCTDHLLVIPQASRSVVLTYHVKNSIPDLTCTLPLPRVVWKAGHRYIYDLVFTPTEIKATVTVTDWDGTPVDDTAIISN
jgi:hypothetical protein